MTQSTLLAASAAALGAGLAYAYLARRLDRDARATSPGSHLRSFALWWATLAINILVVSVTYLLAAFDALPYEAQLFVSIVQRLLLGIGVAGLLRYLIYLRYGRDALLPLAGIYGAYVLLSMVALVTSRPDGVFIGEWRTELTYAAPVAWGRAMNLLVVLPSIVASIAYFLIYFQVDDPQRRYRIAVVSWALVGWWIIAIIAGQRALLDVGWLQVLNRAGSVVTALLVLTAHHPPRSLQTWLANRAPGPTTPDT